MGLRESKSGKTGAACSIRPGGVLVLNGDTGNALVFPRLRERAREGDDSRIMEIGLDAGMMQAMIDVAQAVDQLPESPEDRIFNTVVVDPVGEVHRLLLDDLSSYAIRPSMNVRLDAAVHLERFCRKLCRSDVNVVIVAHDFVVELGDGEVDHLPYTGTQKGTLSLGPKLMGMVDIVGFTGIVESDTGDKVFAAQLVNENGRHGGHRYGDALGSWEPLDLADWFELISTQQTAEASK